MEKILKDVYFNVSSPACYSGVQAVYKEAHKRDPNITLLDVKKYLSRQNTYTLHKPVIRHYPRNKMTSPGLDVKWQADLIDWQSLKAHNNHVAYLLVCIDVFSRFAFVQPLKKKTPGDVLDGFKKMKRQPWILFTDRGREFSGVFKKHLDEKGIRHVYATSDDVKCAMVERLNRTLKTRIWHHITTTGSYKYVGVLQSIVHSINNSHHRMLGHTPASVTHENENEVWKEQTQTDEVPTLRLGDRVRLAVKHKTFDKGYYQTYSDEVFTVVKVLKDRRPVVYKLNDVDAIFYKQELQKIDL